MIIGIDGNEANVERKVGINQYVFELLQQFKQFRIHPPAGGSEFRIYLKDKPRDEMPKEGANWQYRIVKPGKLWTQIGLPLNLYFSKPRPNVFFSPTHYAPRFSSLPTVISVMDLSYIFFPDMFKRSDLFQLQSWTKYSVKNARAILTISQSSKNDIMKVYGIPSEKVVVTYLGLKENLALDSSRKTMNELIKKYKISNNYILFVGTLQPRKNIEKLIEAFALTLKNAEQNAEKGRSEQLQLIIVGKKGWLYEDILEAPRRFGVKDQVKFLDFLSDEELATLYKNAQCFVLPSLYEGFGLPVLEAMAHGCPVITSNVSSLPEAGGDAALYVDPNDVDDIAKKIKQVLGNKKLQEEMREKGKKQVKKFSWEKTASVTLAVLEQVAKEG